MKKAKSWIIPHNSAFIELLLEALHAPTTTVDTWCYHAQVQVLTYIGNTFRDEP